MHLGLTRLYGRVQSGERLYDSEAPGNSGKNISLIGGMSIDGLIATLSRQCQYRGSCSTFSRFLLNCVGAIIVM